MAGHAKVASKDFSAGVAVFSGSSILLAKRIEICPFSKVKIPYPGYWSVFAGSPEGKELPINCAARELYEETKIKVSPNDLLLINIFNQKDHKFYLFSYEVDRLINPVLNFEHTESGWFNINHLSSFPEKIDHNLIKIIKDKCLKQ